VKRNFAVPAGLALLTAVLLIAFGMRPWEEWARFYSLMAISLSVLVFASITSEFYRGARVIREHTGLGWAASAVQLTRRNTRRYGGYLVHYGVIVICIGFAGAAFNQTNEQELGFHDKMNIGAYTLVCQNYTQEDNPNYGSEMAILDVYKNGKKIDTMYPEQRFYKANQQMATMVALRSTIAEDLYLVYAGRNQDTGRPIIKAHVNPLVSWLWAGVLIVVMGTLVALVPNLPAEKAAPRKSFPAAHAVPGNDNGAHAEEPKGVEVGD